MGGLHLPCVGLSDAESARRARGIEEAGATYPSGMSRSRSVVLVVSVALVALLGACSSSDDAASDSTTTEATTTVPGDADVRELVAKRLTDELGDAQVAQAVAAQLDPTILSQFSASVPADEIATTPLLSFRPETTTEPVDSLVVLSFGNRVGADGTLSAGPVNEALADVVQAYVAEHPVPVYAQWEVADLLIDRGVPNVESIGAATGPDGSTTYLSTSGVTDQVVQRAADGGVDLGTVGVVAFADHLQRAVMTASDSGMDAVVVEGMDLPSQYDPESGQTWTQDRTTYVTVDLSGRLAKL